jgi:fido (protein-threonine AMPylation protein)
MPYDDPILKELSGYSAAKEPGRRERADAWATAIGLQAVDGLKPSSYLIETAKAHIEGRITQGQVRRRIRAYYETKNENTSPDRSTREPDLVAERIAAIINDGGFEFTPEYLFSVHAKLFKGVVAQAGKPRTVNIRKHEWILRGDSITYGSKDTLKASLARHFQDEREFDYGGKSPRKVIPHFARFISEIWQVHPFSEGNTRATAVFAIKYLRQLGYRVTNNMFAENSWYFRNALVRANYADYPRGVTRDWSYLEAFFRNLLLGESNELKSRYLLIGLTPQGTDRLKSAGKGESPSEERTEKGCQEKVVRKGCQKTVDRIFELITAQPHLTQEGMSKALGISRQAVQKHLANLKSAGRLRRVGPDKGGHWEAVT